MNSEGRSHPGADAEAGEEPVYAHVGEALAAERERQGLSVEDVADATRVRQEYLHAIEAMDPRRLPLGPYAVGFVRTYARHLGMDPEAAATRFSAEMSPRKKLKEFEVSAPIAERTTLLTRRNVGFAGAVAAGFVVAWVGLQPSGPVDVNEVPPVPEALEAWVRSEPGADGARLLDALEAAEGAEIALSARVPVRLEVYGPGGEVVFANRLRVNEEYAVPQRAGLTIAARNAGAIEVFRDGESMGRMGGAGVPVRGWSVDDARRAAVVESQPLIELEPEPAPVEVVEAVEEPRESYLPESRILTEPLPSVSGGNTDPFASEGWRPVEEPAPAASPPSTGLIVEELPAVRAMELAPLAPAASENAEDRPEGQ